MSDTPRTSNESHRADYMVREGLWTAIEAESHAWEFAAKLERELDNMNEVKTMNQLYIYHVVQEENNGYDTYDSFVVCAKDEKTARETHPWGEPHEDPWNRIKYPGYSGPWASSPEKVDVIKIGTAYAGGGFQDGEIICSSFNAG